MRGRRNLRRERDLAFGWHLVHTLIALIGVGWSWYWWSKREPLESRPR